MMFNWPTSIIQSIHGPYWSEVLYLEVHYKVYITGHLTAYSTLLLTTLVSESKWKVSTWQTNQNSTYQCTQQNFTVLLVIVLLVFWDFFHMVQFILAFSSQKSTFCYIFVEMNFHPHPSVVSLQILGREWTGRLLPEGLMPKITTHIFLC